MVESSSILFSLLLIFLTIIIHQSISVYSDLTLSSDWTSEPNHWLATENCKVTNTNSFCIPRQTDVFITDSTVLTGPTAYNYLISFTGEYFNHLGQLSRSEFTVECKLQLHTSRLGTIEELCYTNITIPNTDPNSNNNNNIATVPSELVFNAECPSTGATKLIHAKPHLEQRASSTIMRFTPPTIESATNNNNNNMHLFSLSTTISSSKACQPYNPSSSRTDNNSDSSSNSPLNPIFITGVVIGSLVLVLIVIYSVNNYIKQTAAREAAANNSNINSAATITINNSDIDSSNTDNINNQQQPYTVL